MRRFYKILLSICLITVFIWGGTRLYFTLTDGFSLSQIRPATYQLHDAPKSPQYSAEEIKNIEQILKQSYSYLGKGAQSYAFVSKDGRYVLKFFKQKHLSPSFFQRALLDLPGMDSYRIKSAAKYKKRWEVLTDSALIAHTYLKDESRLIYLHFEPTLDLLPEVTLHDKLGFTYKIHADDYLFYVQEYILTLRKALENWSDQKSKVALSSVIDILLLRSARGVQEDDGLILDNMGFIDDRPIFLDIGTLKLIDNLHDPKVYNDLLRRDTKPILNYLKKHRPALADWFNAEIESRSSEDL